jgi:hypothetical protein
MKITKKEARKIISNIGKGPKDNGFGRWITDQEFLIALKTLGAIE